MRVGTLCYATEQGLGYLAKSFYDNGIVTDPVVVSYTARGTRPMRTDWYPNAPVVGNLYPQYLSELLPAIKPDVMLFFETPFNWNLIDYCREKGVKTVLMVMHECLDQRQAVEYKPDLFLCPSMLDEVCVKISVRDSRSIFLPVPVDVPWRQRTRAEVFVHNAGWGGLRGRNGTAELFEAMKYLKSDAKFIIRSQQDYPCPPWVWERQIIKHCAHETVPYEQLWAEGDVFCFPERFNGLSLPLQEARAAGMLVMGSDRFPMNTWLPGGPLIPVKDYNLNQRTFPQFCAFDEAVVDPRDIAATIDNWYGKDITEYSLAGRKFAEEMSWASLKPKYLSLLEDLVGSTSRS